MYDSPCESTKAGQLGNEKLKHVKVKGDWQAVAVAIQGTQRERQRVQAHKSDSWRLQLNSPTRKRNLFISFYVSSLNKYAKF